MSTTDESRASSPAAAAAADENSKKRKTTIDEIEVDLALPEPPSKKAKRLLKKGKSLPTKPKSDAESGDDEEDDGLNLPKTGGEGKDNSKKPKRSQYGVWIGNLPWYLTRVDLFKWLIESSGGAISEGNITRVNLPTQKIKDRFPHRTDTEGENGAPKTQNRGFAYVDFDAEPPAIAAMALTETEIGGRKVLIKNSTSFEGRPSANASAIANGNGEGPTTASSGATTATTAAPPTTPKIYVGNLGFQVTEDDLRSHFSKCGDIEWLKIATFEDSGKCKGYGWVKFSEPSAAESAVKGFVRLREEVETEEDFQDKKKDDEGEKKEEGEEEEKKSSYKTRKWWVNRLFGRELKVQYAEDDQTRYKKRFGGKGAATEGGGTRGGGARGGRGGGSRGGGGRGGREGGGRREGGGEGGGEKSFVEKKDKKPPQYGEEGVASYLTGAVVKSQGKKTTFD